MASVLADAENLTKKELVESLKDSQANEALPLLVAAPIAGAAAFTAAHIDARRDVQGGDAAKLITAALGAAVAIAAGDSHPILRAVGGEVAKGGVCAELALMGHESGLEKKAKDAARRAREIERKDRVREAAAAREAATAQNGASHAPANGAAN